MLTLSSTNHFDKTITDGLKKLDLISEDNINLLLLEARRNW